MDDRIKYGTLPYEIEYIQSYLSEYMKTQIEFDKLCILYGTDTVKNIMKAISCSVLDVEDMIKKCAIIDDNVYTFTTQSFELATEPKPQDRITQLKSQLKHCNNYLERQNIERKLNRLYKERR